jgi:hypothetical protein
MISFYLRKILLTHSHYDSPRNNLFMIRPFSSLVLIVKLRLDSTVIGCPLLERIVDASRASSTMAWPLSCMPPVTIRSCPMPSCNTPYTGWVPYYTTFSICRDYLASNKKNDGMYGERYKGKATVACFKLLFQDLKLSYQLMNKNLLFLRELWGDSWPENNNVRY